MNKESFLETIRQHYSDEILEVYNECAHGGNGVDVKQLNDRLIKMMANAKREGLSNAEFEDLVKMLLPTAADQVQLLPVAQAA
jgi:hypothetical protein